MHDKTHPDLIPHRTDVHPSSVDVLLLTGLYANPISAEDVKIELLTGMCVKGETLLVRISLKNG